MRLHLNAPSSSCHTPRASTRRSRNLINSVVVPPFRGTGVLPLVHDGDICTNLERMAFVMSAWPSTCIHFLQFHSCPSGVLPPLCCRKGRQQAGPAGVTHHPALGFVVRWGDRCVTMEMDGCGSARRHRWQQLWRHPEGWHE